jgi:hypothetical protein
VLHRGSKRAPRSMQPRRSPRTSNRGLVGRQPRGRLVLVPSDRLAGTAGDARISERAGAESRIPSTDEGTREGIGTALPPRRPRNGRAADYRGHAKSAASPGIALAAETARRAIYAALTPGVGSGTDCWRLSVKTGAQRPPRFLGEVDRIKAWKFTAPFRATRARTCSRTPATDSARPLVIERSQAKTGGPSP